MQTSVSLRAAVASDRIYWRLCCARHTFMTTTMTQAEDLLQVTDDKWWFNWYMQRMHTRWLVRWHPIRLISTVLVYNDNADRKAVTSSSCRDRFAVDIVLCPSAAWRPSSTLQSRSGSAWHEWHVTAELPNSPLMPASRRTVQRFMKFLDPQSAAAFNSGAPMTNIDAFQCKTCFRFPWQVCCPALL